MSTITLGGNAIHTNGNLPVKGEAAKDFELAKDDLSTVSLSDYDGKNIILNIFPSIDTPTCATSVRVFNQQAAKLTDTVILCISRDLPFAQKRFCGAEGIENVYCLSDFKDGSFGKDYGLEITDGKFEGLHSRAVVVIDKDRKIAYSEQVAEIANEPNYDAALASI